MPLPSASEAALGSSMRERGPSVVGVRERVRVVLPGRRVRSEQLAFTDCSRLRSTPTTGLEKDIWQAMGEWLAKRTVRGWEKNAVCCSATWQERVGKGGSTSISTRALEISPSTPFASRHTPPASRTLALRLPTALTRRETEKARPGDSVRKVEGSTVRPPEAKIWQGQEQGALRGRLYPPIPPSPWGSHCK